MKRILHFSLIFTVFFILSLNKASAQWYSIPQLKYTNIYCSLSLGDSTFFVGGDNMTLLRTTDNGNTWTNIMNNGIAVDSVLSLGKGLGYIFAGANGVEDIYRSSDNGDTWGTANKGLPGHLLINQFAFVDTSLFVATNAGVFSSADSGKTWQPDNSGLNVGFVSPGLNNSTVGIVAAGKNLYTIEAGGGKVYMTSKDSVKWKQITKSYYNIGYAIVAIDTDILIACEDGIYLYDGDSTWTARDSGLPVNDTTYITSCRFTVSDSMLFAYIFSSTNHSFSKDIYVTSDLGNYWKKVNDSVAARSNITTIAANKEYLFAGTQMGGWRIPISNLITSVEDDKMQTPSLYFLAQNYPNPFNPSTIIKYQIPKEGYVVLKVYDILGNIVKTLVDGYKTQGKYSVNFNASNLSSGVYFYQLRAGNFVAAKKLLLLK